MGTFSAVFAKSLRPVAITTVSEWADEYRFISSKASNEPGRWRTSRTPHLREIMDELSMFTPSRKVVIMKASQMGVTECAINSIGFHIVLDPGPILVIMPTEQLAKKIAQQKFETMVDASPEISKLVGKSGQNPLTGKEEKNSETILTKDFLNGTISFGSASSPNSLSSVAAKLLIMDEVDRYKTNVKNEGDPVALAANRCAAMSRYKIALLSTPTVSGESLIEKEFEESDQRYYLIPCPHCEHPQQLELKNFRFEMDERTKTASDAWFSCTNCGERIEERKKALFLPLGRYVSSQTGSCPGFHISQFYSPPGWRGWREIATLYNRAVVKNDENLMKAFYNTVLGLSWKAPSTRPKWDTVFQRSSARAPGIAHKDVLIITAGIDVQGDRLECQLLGFCRTGQTHVVDYAIFMGDTSSAGPWDALAQYLMRDVPTDRENVKIPISKAAIDTGYRTTIVYDFIRRLLPDRKLVAIKGRDDMLVPVGRPARTDGESTSQKIRKGVDLYPVGVSVLKERVYSDIQAVPDAETGEFPKNFVFFPELPHEYFKQLTSEESRVVYKKGRESRQWSSNGRNEALDTFVYALGAYYLLGIHRYSDRQWNELSDMLAPAETSGEKVTLLDKSKPVPRKVTPRKSEYWR